jgi:hypothetical protein
MAMSDFGNREVATGWFVGMEQDWFGWFRYSNNAQTLVPF